MNYIYHAVPENMIGNLLIPLNEIHDLDKSLKEEYLEKYTGREAILERKLPMLECLWNDVVQFLPIHPRKVFELQVELGIIPDMPSYKYFKIDINLLDPDKTIVFFKSVLGGESVEMKWLKDINFESLQDIPDSTIEYFKSTIGTGELPFNYQFIPHILYLGSVDVSEQRIITL